MEAWQIHLDVFGATRNRGFAQVFFSCQLRDQQLHVKSVCRWIKKNYNDPEVMITENGWSDDGQLEDLDRVEYYRSHLEQILTVVLNKECNLKAYTGWPSKSFPQNTHSFTLVSYR